MTRVSGSSRCASARIEPGSSDRSGTVRLAFVLRCRPSRGPARRSLLRDFLACRAADVASILDSACGGHHLCNAPAQRSPTVCRAGPLATTPVSDALAERYSPRWESGDATVVAARRGRALRHSPEPCWYFSARRRLLRTPQASGGSEDRANGSSPSRRLFEAQPGDFQRRAGLLSGRTLRTGGRQFLDADFARRLPTTLPAEPPQPSRPRLAPHQVSDEHLTNCTNRGRDGSGADGGTPEGSLSSRRLLQFALLWSVLPRLLDSAPRALRRPPCLALGVSPCLTVFETHRVILG